MADPSTVSDSSLHLERQSQPSQKVPEAALSGFPNRPASRGMRWGNNRQPHTVLTGHWFAGYHSQAYQDGTGWTNRHELCLPDPGGILSQAKKGNIPMRIYSFTWGCLLLPVHLAYRCQAFSPAACVPLWKVGKQGGKPEWALRVCALLSLTRGPYVLGISWHCNKNEASPFFRPLPSKGICSGF